MPEPDRIAHTAEKSAKGEATFCSKCGTLMIDAAGPTVREGAVMILMKDPQNPSRTLYIASGPGGDIGDAVPCDQIGSSS